MQAEPHASDHNTTQPREVDHTCSAPQVEDHHQTQLPVPSARGPSTSADVQLPSLPATNHCSPKPVVASDAVPPASLALPANDRIKTTISTPCPSAGLTAHALSHSVHSDTSQAQADSTGTGSSKPRSSAGEKRKVSSEASAQSPACDSVLGISGAKPKCKDIPGLIQESASSQEVRISRGRLLM